MESNSHKSIKDTSILLFSVFSVGLCTIIYELLIGSVSSYFLGDSVKQFSITIGLTMSSMGIGTYLSRKIEKNLLKNFILIEVVMGILGGLSVPILYFAFAFSDSFYPFMIILIFSLGILMGLEIPILTRVMEKHYELKFNISNVLSFDYFGSLVASLIFPFVFLPFLGLLKSSLVAGLINLFIAILTWFWFRKGLKNFNHYRNIIFTSFIALIAFFALSDPFTKVWENSLFDDRVIFRKQSNYQKIVLTKNKKDLRLYLDGNLQFSSVDEHRYHESLIHVPMSYATKRKNILLLGGGDGLAVREILNYRDVKKIDLVDLDPEITRLAKTNKLLLKYNKRSLFNKKVQVINQDAFVFLKNGTELYDLILADLPDPNNASLSRLYSKEFYKLIKKRLSRQGIFVTQSTSPFFANKSFWCINSSIKAGGFKNSYPYHSYVPSFGDWGFIMATNYNLNLDNYNLIQGLKYLNKKGLEKLFHFPEDLKRKNIPASSLNKPIVLNYYLSEWVHWN